MSYLNLNEDKRLKDYEFIASINGTESGTKLGYFDMNTRELEKENKKKNKKRVSHESQKDTLEKAWVENTSQRAKAIKENANGEDPKKTAYYKPFSLKEMEVLLKNNDRGGNSAKYNTVATDLELYNSVENAIDDSEKIDLLERLVHSCMEYMGSTFKGFRDQGKIRKAMINSISVKASQKSGEIKKEWEVRKEQLIGQANEAYKAVITDNDISRLNEATRIHHDIITKHNLGFYKLSDDEIKIIDKNFAEILTVVNKQDIHEGQNPDVVSNFFNAIGWSENTPRLVDRKELEEGGNEINKSRMGSKMYHCINTLPDNDNAIPQAQQLAGTRKDGVNSQYYSNGMGGKGTYFATQNVRYTMDSKDKSKMPTDEPSDITWRFGSRNGSIQVTACLNEHAKMVRFGDLKRLRNIFMDRFPLVAGKLPKGTIEDRNGFGSMTSFVSFWGYNVVVCESNMENKCSYIVVTDRKAISMAKDAVLLGGEKFSLETGEILK